MNQTTTYSQKLKDPRWQKKRLEILERDNWTCCGCGATDKELQVHHSQYNGKPWDAHSDNLQTLCHECHELISEAIKHFRISVSQIKPADARTLSYAISIAINGHLAVQEDAPKCSRIIELMGARLRAHRTCADLIDQDLISPDKEQTLCDVLTCLYASP